MKSKYMNRILCITLLAAVVACKPSVKDGITTGLIDPAHPPVIQFTDSVYNFGKITQGESVSYSFDFINKGGSSLIISDVRPSCGCTVPQSWPKHPVKPGDAGKIEITFNSEGRTGEVTRTIRITSNAKPNINILYIKGEIIAPE